MKENNQNNRLHNSGTRPTTHQNDVRNVAPDTLPVDHAKSLPKSVEIDYASFALAVGAGHGCGSVCHAPQTEDDYARKIDEIHDLIVKRSATRLASLNQTERDLYEAADEREPLSAHELCLRTDAHDLNSRTKGCLSNLVKLGLLSKAGGRKGYLKTPTKVVT